jgi:dolichol kinase
VLPLPVSLYLFRKFVHLALVVVVFFQPQPPVLIAFALAAGLLSLLLPFISAFRRFFYSEGDLGPFVYFLFVALAFALFPPPVASLAWIILAVGDSIAPFGSFIPAGFSFRRTNKTLSGLLLYAMTASAAVLLSAPVLSPVPPSTADLAFASLAAALLDAQARRPWDNILPPLVAALVLALP